MRIYLTVILALALGACVGGREKLSGAGILNTPLASINVVSAKPSVKVHDVANRGLSVRVVIEKSEPAVGVVILFAGGKGPTHISNQGDIGQMAGNFLVRSRHLFRRHGLTTVVFDSPSDATEDLRQIHDGAAFAGDVGAVIQHLRRHFGLPIWIVGTSSGTVAVANAASRFGKNAPDGVVFTSSLFDGNRTAGVFDLPLENIQIPSLIVHHRRDSCAYTGPSRVPEFKARLTGAKIAKVMWFDGGSSRGDACQARSHHGYNGIEEMVVTGIANWIKEPVSD